MVRRTSRRTSKIVTGGTVDEQVIGFEFDPEEAERQRTMRNFSSSQQIGDAYAASRLQDSTAYAKRELEKLLALRAAGQPVDPKHISDLESIVNPAWWQGPVKTLAPVFSVLELIDRPRQLLTLAANDLLGWDTKDGVEIGGGNYVDVVLGRKDKLVADLGVDIVGEHGDISFSTVLDDLGWEKTDSFLNKTARFGAQVLGEVGTDPLTYITFGASGLAKAQRARFLLKAVDDGADATLDLLKAGNSAIDLGADATRLERHMADVAGNKSQQIQDEVWGEIDTALASGVDETGVLAKYGLDDMVGGDQQRLIPSTVDDIGDTRWDSIQGVIRDDAVHKAVLETNDEVFNRALPALMAKDFGDDMLKMIADSSGSSILKGGVKMQIPIFTQKTGKASRIVPGTRGLGRKVSNLILGHSKAYKNAAKPGQGATGIAGWLQEGLTGTLYDRWTDVALKFGDGGFWRHAMGGTQPNARKALRLQDDTAVMMADLIDNSGIKRVAQSAIAISNMAKQHKIPEKDLEAMIRGMGDLLETAPNASVDDIITHLGEAVARNGGEMASIPRELAAAAQTWAVESRQYLRYMHARAKDLGMEVGDGLENYTPHYMTSQANDVMDTILDLGIDIQGDDIGDQILKAMIEARRRSNAGGDTVIGEASSATERKIGRTVARGTGDASIPFAIGDSLLFDKTYAAAGLTARELNESLGQALKRLEDTNIGFSVPKGKKGQPFQIYNENPFATIQAYGHDMMMAVAERTLINALEKVGLVSDAVRYINQQDLAAQVQRNLGNFGRDALAAQELQLGQLLDNKIETLRAIRDGSEVMEEMVEYTVGGETFSIPKAALEANRRLAARMDNISSRSANAVAVNERAKAFYEDAFLALRKGGKDERTARNLALAATAKELNELTRAAIGEIRIRARRITETNAYARATTHADRLDAAEAAYQAQLSQDQLIRNQIKDSKAAIDRQVRANTGKTDEVVSLEPIDSAEGMEGLTKTIRQQQVDDLEQVAESLMDVGEVESARLVRTIREQYMSGAADDNTIESLGANIKEIIDQAVQLQKQRTESIQADLAGWVAEADKYMDQALHYQDNFLDPGDWGPEQYASARYVFHGTDRPSMAQMAESSRYGGGGLTSNPVRAAGYADDQYVIVWDMDSMPEHIRGSLRAGQDIETRDQLEALMQQGSRREVMPRPIAVIPAAAMREAATRRALDPDAIQKLAGNIGAEAWGEVMIERSVSRGLGSPELVERYTSVINRALDDPTFAGSNQFTDELEDLLSQAAEGREGWQFSHTPENLIAELKESITRHREWTRKGPADAYQGKPPDLRTDKARQAVLSVWYDNWVGDAKKGAKTAPVGEPVAAPWVRSAAEAESMGDYGDVYLGLHGADTRHVQPVNPETGELNLAEFNAQIDDWWTARIMEVKRGEPSPEMADIYDATQRSLAARSLPAEVPVWIIGDAADDYSMARMSLVPVEGAETAMILREDILMDFGAFIPNSRGQGAATILEAQDVSRKHHVLADPSRVRVGDAVDELLTKGMPPKSTLHRIRPENMNYQRMLSIFGDPVVADRAYADLMSRLDLVGPPKAQLLERLGEAHGLTAPVYKSNAVAIEATGRRISALAAAEKVYTQPEIYGTVFDSPLMQKWFTEAAAEAGHDIGYARRTLVQDSATGRWVPATPGTADSITVTVPAYRKTDVVERPSMKRTALEAELKAQGLTVTEAKMIANRRSRYMTMSQAELESLPPTERAMIEGAEVQFQQFDRPEAVYNTLTAVQDEAGEALDRAHRLADELASRQGKKGDVDQLLGRRTNVVDQAQVVASARTGIENVRAQLAIQGRVDLGATVRVSNGQDVTRGVAIGSGMGEVRYAAPDGLTDEVMGTIDTQIDDWVAVNFENLQRSGAHIGIWMDHEAGELVLEVAGVMDTVGRARRVGMDFDQIAVHDLATGKNINLPTSTSRLRSAVRKAEKGVESDRLLTGIDDAIERGRWDQAEGILTDSHNEQVMRTELGGETYRELLDLVETERYIAKGAIPNKNALRAARQARKTLDDMSAARAATAVLVEEAKAMRVMSLQKEVQELMDTQARVASLVGDILGVGLDEKRVFGDASLYPKQGGTVTLEASEQVKLRVKEAAALAKRLGWDKTEAALNKALDETPFAVMAQAGKPQGEHVFSVFGVGGRVTDYKTTTDPIASMIEETMSRWQTLSTPEGMEMFTKQTRWIARAWKSMATVARPGFHPRNLIGGVFNGMTADVGVAEYIWVKHKAVKLRRLQAQGLTPDEMAKHFDPADWLVINDARRHGIFGEGFAAGDVGIEMPKGRRGEHALRDALINPGSGDWLANRAGGATMMTIEDFLRLAAFKRWHTELGAEGARTMVNMVHFNYAALSAADQRIKQFVPFWIWTKNNVPLQVRMMIERPGIAGRYNHLMNAVDDNFGGDKEHWPGGQYMSPLAADLGITLGDDQNWARMIFDPDVPVKDLEMLDNPLSFDFVSNVMGNMLGPHVTLPLQVGEQNEWGSTNAPFGWNEALKAVDMTGLWDQQVSAQGHAQIGYGTRNALNTAVPVLNEYAGLLGLRTDPEQQQKVGITTEDGVSLTERIAGGLTFLGRGFGLQGSTPNDARVAAYATEQRVRETIEMLQLQGIIPPDVEGRPSARPLRRSR